MRKKTKSSLETPEPPIRWSRYNNYTVNQEGEVEPATWPVKDDLTPKELVDAACRVLRLSHDSFHHEIAERLFKRWDGAAPGTQPLIRAHIAAILAIQRGLCKHNNKIDYTLISLCHGDEEARRYLDELIPKWEGKEASRNSHNNQK